MPLSLTRQLLQVSCFNTFPLLPPSVGSGGEHRLPRAAVLHEPRLDEDPEEEERQEARQEEEEEEGGGRVIRYESTVHSSVFHRPSVPLFFTAKGQSWLLILFFISPVSS